MEYIKCAEPGRVYLAHETEILDCIKSVARGGNYILSEEVSRFEKDFASYIGMTFCVGVASGTDALILGMIGIGISPGDEVLLPSLTATATVSSVEWIGATPVFVDITDDMTIDSDEILKKITTKTKAIIGVHLYGGSCNMDALMKISNAYDIPIIEDCAQSCGARYKDSKLGSFGKISCFSFYPTKNLGALGDGGAILTNDESVFRKLLELRQYGWNSDRVSISKGRVSRLDEIQAAILNIKLKYLDQENTLRREVARKYSEGLASLPLGLPKEESGTFHVYHLYVVKLQARDKVKSLLHSKGIGTGIHYFPPVHENPNFESYFPSNKDQSLNQTSRSSREILSLPMHPYLTFEEISKVITTLNEII